jgi:PRTRC genetic system ThiF family protein
MKTTSPSVTKPPMHFVPQYFLAPRCPIRVTLIGAGGNGSQMLSALARIDHALRALGQKGLAVTVWDPDTVEAPNVGRQLFTAGDLGQNKAECLVTRFNRLFGNDWKAEPKEFKAGVTTLGNIVITCVDNVACRKEVAKAFRGKDITAKAVEKYHKTKGGTAFNEYNEYYTFYWLDLGNAQKTGQAILGSNRIPQPDSKEYETVEYLPVVTEVFNLTKSADKGSGPSCSMAEALSKQDLFVNSVLVQTAASLLWSLLTDLAIDTRGFFVNLDTYRTTPVPVKKEDILLTPGRRNAKDNDNETEKKD